MKVTMTVVMMACFQALCNPVPVSHTSISYLQNLKRLCVFKAKTFQGCGV